MFFFFQNVEDEGKEKIFMVVDVGRAIFWQINILEKKLLMWKTE
jgi:hypothetical protein